MAHVFSAMKKGAYPATHITPKIDNDRPILSVEKIASPPRFVSPRELPPDVWQVGAKFPLENGWIGR